MIGERKVVKLIFLFFIFLTSYFLFSPSSSLAQDPNYDQVNEIAKDLNCPTCTGINLADCRTLTCEQWRDQINELVEQGYSNEEVLNYFTTRYGEEVLQAPPKSGWRLFLWVLPFVVLLAGGVWLIYALRQWARRDTTPEVTVTSFSTPSSGVASVPGSYMRQVEKDLQGDE